MTMTADSPTGSLTTTDQRTPQQRQVDGLYRIADDWSPMTAPYLVWQVAAIVPHLAGGDLSLVHEAAEHLEKAHRLDAGAYDLIPDYLYSEDLTGDDDLDSETARDQARDIARERLLILVEANERARTLAGAA